MAVLSAELAVISVGDMHLIGGGNLISFKFHNFMAVRILPKASSNVINAEFNQTQGKTKKKKEPSFVRRCLFSKEIQKKVILQYVISAVQRDNKLVPQTICNSFRFDSH